MMHSLLQLLNRTLSLVSLKSIHALLITEGSINSSDLILNKILRLYMRFNATDIAQKLFDEIPQPNSFLWTALIHGYVENVQYSKSLELFRKMHSEAVTPLNFTVASVLKALARAGRPRDGEAVYGFVLKSGVFDLIVKNALLDSFMRFGEIDVARRVFDEMDEKDIVSWNSMVVGYGNNGKVDIARQFFDNIPERNVISWTSMICGYVKDGNMVQASALFELMPMKDLASRNVMLSAYVDSGDIASARRVFTEMGIPNVGSWNLMISGFFRAGDIKSAEEIFEEMPKRNIASWTIMIDGYMKAGDFESARSLFDQMPEENLISWSTMIQGYARNGQPRQALELYEQFKKKGINPDETFVLGVISACSQLGIINAAESIVSEVLGHSALSNMKVLTSLIEMYAKCGSIKKALEVFKMAYRKDVLCYSAMILAFANHGLSCDAISLFQEMQNENIRPDEVTFLGVLTACNHGGLVDEGRKYFKQMKSTYGLKPSEKHYACLIDLLGRAGFLEEAYKLINEMTVMPHAVVWGALLAACRVHCNVELAEIAAAELFKIEQENSGNYILLSNIYAAAGRWDGVAKVRTMIRENEVRKSRGLSWIELGGVVHEFFMGDNSHIDSEAIYFVFSLLSEDMKLLRNVHVHAINPSGSCCYDLLDDG